MSNKTVVAMPILEASQVGEARRTVSLLAESAGLNETDQGKAAVIVAEAANNLVKHTGGLGGEVVLQVHEPWPGENDVLCLDILALDNGPGMMNVPACLRDGYSTAGTPGTGLGAMRRLSDTFDVFSAPGAGTALLARLGPSPAPQGGLALGAVCVPLTGETVCGDAWAVHDDVPFSRRILVADGLGHGPSAAQASGEAVRVFRTANAPGAPPPLLPDTLRRLHDALRPTRGAAIALVDVDTEAGFVRFVGAGNIAGAIVSPAGEARHLVSHNGTVGHQLPRVQEFAYPLPPGALVILASDGLSTQWRLDRYPGLLSHHPMLIAGVLYRDFSRRRDDVCVVVVKQTEEEEASS